MIKMFQVNDRIERRIKILRLDARESDRNYIFEQLYAEYFGWA